MIRYAVGLVVVLVLVMAISVIQADHVSAQVEPPAEEPVGVAVVELFTSQGCSSCPPADQVLSQVAQFADQRDLPVYCLSFHVDYWNKLGWTDPYSARQFSERQRAYARALQARGVYTPQMVVNGQTEFVGSRGSDAAQAISAALRTESRMTITLDPKLSSDGENVTIRYDVVGNTEGAWLNVAIVDNPAPNSVSRGENAGRQLRHTNVVRAFYSEKIDAAEGHVELDVPSELQKDSAKIIAFVQRSDTLQITAAVDADLHARS